MQAHVQEQRQPKPLVLVWTLPRDSSLPGDVHREFEGFRITELLILNEHVKTQFVLLAD